MFCFSLVTKVKTRPLLYSIAQLTQMQAIVWQIMIMCLSFIIDAYVSCGYNVIYQYYVVIVVKQKITLELDFIVIILSDIRTKKNKSVSYHLNSPHHSMSDLTIIGIDAS